ncbi:MAG: hypothetical protein M1816_000403 [Peltula sp. TS41687]|nr:MAG: hypothetical protein M1816_000403 [Peltula sp. TS41687]
MIFNSKLPDLLPPTSDVFSYIFTRRREYPRDRVLFRANHDNETLTLAQLETKSRRFAHGLVTRYSIKPDDVVAIFALDTIQYPIAYLGILAAGATVALIPVQAQLTASDLATRIHQAEARLLVTSQSLFQVAEEASRQAGYIPLATLDGDNSQLGELVDNNPEYHDFHLKTFAEAEAHTAFINRTSGSTGNMKSVLTTHAHFLAVMEATLRTIPSNTDPDNDVWFSSLSLGFFINAKLHMGLNILLGIPVILLEEPFDARSLEVIERHRITFCFLPPPVAASLAKSDTGTKDLSSIKWLLSAGAPMHENLQQAVSQKLNGVQLSLEWGTSETLLITIQPEGGRGSIPGSSGVLVNGMQAKVISTVTGEELGPYQRGEILVRNSVCRFAGYKSNDIANAAAFDEDGWFHSGDFGHLDENCNVFITDRLKELIRVGTGYGVHISATELEAVLFEHPVVDQVVVIACRNPSTQVDHPTAFIVLKSAFQHSIQQRQAAFASINALSTNRLQGLQQLSGGIIFISKLPTIGFKIDRQALKRLANEHLYLLPHKQSHPARAALDDRSPLELDLAGPRYIEMA